MDVYPLAGSLDDMHLVSLSYNKPHLLFTPAPPPPRLRLVLYPGLSYISCVSHSLNPTFIYHKPDLKKLIFHHPDVYFERELQLIIKTCNKSPIHVRGTGPLQENLWKKKTFT